MIDDGDKGGVVVLEPQTSPTAETSEAEGGSEEMVQAATKQVEDREVSLTELQDNELVARFLAGNGLAFPELVRRYQSRLLNFIYRTIGDRDRAEDLVQETFIRVYRHLHRFDQ